MDFVWLMGVWQRSDLSRQVCVLSPELRNVFEKALPGHSEADILGSPYAVLDYQPEPALGNWEDLKKVRRQLNERGMGLVLDFVPNHTAADHRWVYEHPEFYILGSQEDYRRDNNSFFEIESRGQKYYPAHGRDPNFEAWTDTAQLNFFNPAMRAALINEVHRLAGFCDGLRCDMAMLVMNEVISRVWGSHSRAPLPASEFWRDLTGGLPDLLFSAEAYWDKEWELQQMGFDYVYDKRLYDRLKSNPPGDVRGHLRAEMDYQKKLVRFIENHDEECSLAAFGVERVKGAAALISMLPGMKLYHHGQTDGRRIKMPVQLSRSHSETANPEIEYFYRRLLAAAGDRTAHEGAWKLKTVYEHADQSHHNLIAYTRHLDRQAKLVIVNLSPQPSQGRIVFEDEIDEYENYSFKDRVSGEDSLYKGLWMVHPGLIFELSGYQARVFDIQPAW